MPLNTAPPRTGTSRPCTCPPVTATIGPDSWPNERGAEQAVPSSNPRIRARHPVRTTFDGAEAVMSRALVVGSTYIARPDGAVLAAQHRMGIALELLDIGGASRRTVG